MQRSLQDTAWEFRRLGFLKRTFECYRNPSGRHNIQSFVESASGAVLVWRLLAERRGVEAEEVARLDARAHELVGASLFLLAAYIVVDASVALWTREAPKPSLVGIVLTVVSIVAMQLLARAKRRAARELRAGLDPAFRTPNASPRS